MSSLREIMSAALQAIKDLRQKLTKAGARTFSTNSPWPGCVNVMVFPEQMVEKVPASFSMKL